MPNEGFLKRWSRRKTESRLGQAPPSEPPQEDAAALEPPPDAQAPRDAAAPRAGADADAGVPTCACEVEPAAEPLRLPTLDDVATLTPDSDYSAFVARGVDPAVRRSALKKLFADPHFNTMDRLDIYIDDYTKPSPVSEAMLASLRHAARLFERVADEEAGADAGPALPAAGEPSTGPDETSAAATGGPPGAAPESGTYPQDLRHSPETETR